MTRARCVTRGNRDFGVLYLRDFSYVCVTLATAGLANLRMTCRLMDFVGGHSTNPQYSGLPKPKPN